jgi:hypothetical protein
LEASDGDGVKVLLDPRMCFLTGILPEQHRNGTGKDLAHLEKVTAGSLRESAVRAAKLLNGHNGELLRAWGLQFETQPVEIEAGALDDLHVSFDDKKWFAVENGNFQRSRA